MKSCNCSRFCLHEAFCLVVKEKLFNLYIESEPTFPLFAKVETFFHDSLTFQVHVLVVDMDVDDQGGGHGWKGYG